MDVALLLLRLAIGALFIGHGTQKLFGWFGGYGLEGTGGFFESIGFRPGRANALLAGVAEAGGGLLLVLGLFTPLAAAGIVGTMVVAIVVVHLPKGLWTSNGGYEMNLVYIVAVVVLAIAPGEISLDDAFGLAGENGIWGVAYGVGALVLGLVTAGARLATRSAVAPAAGSA